MTDLLVDGVVMRPAGRNEPVRAVAARTKDEVIELVEAVESGDLAAILDELADVHFYLDKLSSVVELSPDMIRGYGSLKNALRMSGVRNKRVELRLADEFANKELP